MGIYMGEALTGAQFSSDESMIIEVTFKKVTMLKRYFEFALGLHSLWDESSYT